MKKNVILGLTLLMGLNLSAEVVLAPIFSDNMVIQQNAEVKFRGMATPNKKVIIETSWDKNKITTTADAEGNWQQLISTPEASGPFDIKFNDGKETKLKDILVGDVWLCSGQSNMEMPVKGFRGQPVYGNLPYIATAKENRDLRFYTVARDWSTTPKKDIIRTGT